MHTCPFQPLAEVSLPRLQPQTPSAGKRAACKAHQAVHQTLNSMPTWWDLSAERSRGGHLVHLSSNTSITAQDSVVHACDAWQCAWPNSCGPKAKTQHWSNPCLCSCSWLGPLLGKAVSSAALGHGCSCFECTVLQRVAIAPCVQGQGPVASTPSQPNLAWAGRGC